MKCATCYKSEISSKVVAEYWCRTIYSGTSVMSAEDYCLAIKDTLLDCDNVIIKIVDECPRCKYEKDKAIRVLKLR